MKKTVFLLYGLLVTIGCGAQSYWPEQSVKDMKGRTRNLKDFASEKGATLFVFWKTCCPNNITMIEELYEVWSEYEDEEKPIKVVLVSVDDQRTASRVRPLVSSNGWDWEVIMDKNGNLARTYNIIIPPQWIALDRSGKEIFRSKITNGSLDSGIFFGELVDKLNKNN